MIEPGQAGSTRAAPQGPISIHFEGRSDGHWLCGGLFETMVPVVRQAKRGNEQGRRHFKKCFLVVGETFVSATGGGVYSCHALP